MYWFIIWWDQDKQQLSTSRLEVGAENQLNQFFSLGESLLN